MAQTKITVYRNGKPVQGIKVALEYNGFTQLGFSQPAYTDRDGVAIVTHSNTGPATLWVDSKSRHKISTPGSDIVYL